MDFGRGRTVLSASSQSFDGAVEGMAPAIAEAVSNLRVNISARVATRIEDVECAWRQLSAGSMDSPGQCYDFIRLWVRDRNIPATQQRYVIGEVDGQVAAILPLHLKRVWGIKVFTWFPGTNAGCYAPIADKKRLAALGPAGRKRLWETMTGQLSGAGLVYLRSIPSENGEAEGLFDELGFALDTETLYRAQFSSWAECDAEQRSRSRRKHDRQQGDRLASMGAVSFEEISDPAVAHEVTNIMFRQRSERFQAQGIRDCFVEDRLINFYHAALEPASGIDVRLHVLRLDGAVVAVRYNIVQGTTMFCLISSMSDCLEIQAGSPGKQCLLRVMQTVFDAGIQIFDMGAGFTDEKRHWCNVQTRLRHHYVSLTAMGEVIAEVHSAWHRLRVQAKSSLAVKTLRRKFQQIRDRLRVPSNQL